MSTLKVVVLIKLNSCPSKMILAIQIEPFFSPPHFSVFYMFQNLVTLMGKFILILCIQNWYSITKVMLLHSGRGQVLREQRKRLQHCPLGTNKTWCASNPQLRRRWCQGQGGHHQPRQGDYPTRRGPQSHQAFWSCQTSLILYLISNMLVKSSLRNSYNIVLLAKTKLGPHQIHNFNVIDS